MAEDYKNQKAWIYRDYKQDNKNKPVVTKKYADSDGSSSAYSYGSSDEDFEDEDDSPRKTNVSSTKQGGQKQAWNVNGSSNDEEYCTLSWPCFCNLVGVDRGEFNGETSVISLSESACNVCTS
jgi:hypothetical protein